MDERMTQDDFKLIANLSKDDFNTFRSRGFKFEDVEFFRDRELDSNGEPDEPLTKAELNSAFGYYAIH